MFEVRTGTDILADNLKYVVQDDKRALDNYLGGCGWAYILGAVCVIPITILKLIKCFFSTSTWCFKTPYKEKNNKGIGLSSKVFTDIRRGRTLVSLNHNYNEEILLDSEKELNTEINELTALRNYLIKSNFKLHGTVLRTDFPKIKGEELLYYTQSGELISKAFITMRVTFGNDINSLLKSIFKNKVKVRKMRNKEETYIVFNNSEVVELEKELKSIFLEDVTIKLNRLP